MLLLMLVALAGTVAAENPPARQNHRKLAISKSAPQAVHAQHGRHPAAVLHQGLNNNVPRFKQAGLDALDGVLDASAPSSLLRAAKEEAAQQQQQTEEEDILSPHVVENSLKQLQAHRDRSVSPFEAFLASQRQEMKAQAEAIPAPDWPQATSVSNDNSIAPVPQLHPDNAAVNSGPFADIEASNRADLLPANAMLMPVIPQAVTNPKRLTQETLRGFPGDDLSVKSLPMHHDLDFEKSALHSNAGIAPPPADVVDAVTAPAPVQRHNSLVAPPIDQMKPAALPAEMGGEERTSRGTGPIETDTAALAPVAKAASGIRLLHQVFSVIEMEHQEHRTEVCAVASRKKALTALILGVVFPPAAHFYYDYVGLGCVQLVLYLLMLSPFCFACGWYCNPMPKGLRQFPYESTLGETMKHIDEQQRWLITLLCISGALLAALLGWQVALVVRIATNDFSPADGCPAYPI
jgi:hypothetical protein